MGLKGPKLAQKSTLDKGALPVSRRVLRQAKGRTRRYDLCSVLRGNGGGGRRLRSGNDACLLERTEVVECDPQLVDLPILEMEKVETLEVRPLPARGDPEIVTLVRSLVRPAGGARSPSWGTMAVRPQDGGVRPRWR